MCERCFSFPAAGGPGSREGRVRLAICVVGGGRCTGHHNTRPGAPTALAALPPPPLPRPVHYPKFRGRRPRRPRGHGAQLALVSSAPSSRSLRQPSTACSAGSGKSGRRGGAAAPGCPSGAAGGGPSARRSPAPLYQGRSSPRARSGHPAGVSHSTAAAGPRRAHAAAAATPPSASVSAAAVRPSFSGSADAADPFLCYPARTSRVEPSVATGC